MPIVLNTSLNKNEPIVNTPSEAINCFKRTKMDVLILGNYYIVSSSVSTAGSEIEHRFLND